MSAAWIAHETKEKILPEDPDRIHLRIAAAMEVYLRAKKYTSSVTTHALGSLRC
ncbi:MAG: hypothetical protein XD43_0921 [Thermococcales archaeon 44_46]|nr:MAG: hypothetical protein XD43_0921 [Thermococcales archaeon 44_46]HIH73262.1 hypothetical protein [Thermococcaceae archaeon]